MKIKFKSNNPKKEYDELLEINELSKTLINNPKKKVNLHTRSLIKRLLLCVICVLLFIALIMMGTNTKMHLVLMGIILVSSIILIVMLIQTKSKINKYANEVCESTIDFSNDEINFYNKNHKCKLLWNNIKYVIINKYSICFLPYKMPNIVVSVPSSIREDIIKILIKLNKQDKLVDNSSKY
jgi:hypothetical protein